ncbi:uncharacterized protein JCM15063_003579 [Sporobolomyces koalae]|uniref:uncharacterized protein n=1 Tax=Sporobolomyces koalae TaxID=500713 RepID=UPI003174DE49
MSLDVSDTRIRQAYQAILASDPPLDWCSFGYLRTPSKLHLYAQGSDGLAELRQHLVADEVQYGLSRIERKIILWTLIPEAVEGVKRARALVHSRALASIFKSHHARFAATCLSDFEPSHMRAFMRLDPIQPHSRTVSNSYSTSSTTHSPPLSSLDPSLGSNNSTIQPSEIDRRLDRVGSKGKERGFEQQSFDLHHEYRSDHYEQSHLDSQDAPPAVPEKSPASFWDHHSSIGAQASSPAIPVPLESPVPSPSPQSSTFVPRDPEPDSRIRPVPVSEERTHSGLPPLGAPIATDPSQLSSLSTPLDKAMIGQRFQRPVSESPAARMMLSPRMDTMYDDRTSSVYHSVENDHDPETEPTRTNEEDERIVEPDRHEQSQVQARTTDEQDDNHEGAIVDSYTSTGEDDRRQGEGEEEEAAEIERERAQTLALLEEEIERRRIEHEERERAQARKQQEEEEAAEALRVEEEARMQRELEQETERLRLEAEQVERDRKAKEEMRLMIEREKLERKLRQEEEARKQELERVRLREEKRKALVERKNRGETMVTGEISVQAAGSMLWRRRYYELDREVLTFFKSQSETVKALDSVSIAQIDSIISHPDEPLPPHSFKIVLQQEGDEWLFYGADEEEKERLIDALSIARTE